MNDGDPTRGARLGMTGLVLTLVGVVVVTVLARETGSFVLAGLSIHLLGAAVVWGLLTSSERGRGRAEADRIEAERLASLSREGRRALFEGRSQAGEGLAARQRFESVGLPILTVVLALLEGGLGVWLLRRYPSPGEEVSTSLLAAAVLGGAAFIYLVLGRYANTLAQDGQHLAAAGARRAASSSLLCFVGALALAGHHSFGLPQADLLGYPIAIIAVVLGVEALLLLLLEAYRPRRSDEVVRPPYDSRLLGIISSPTDLARSIAHSVDYQFGFAISQTWFYRFLERWVAPLILFTGLSFWLMTSLVVLQPEEQAVLRRLGRTQDDLLGPGLHLKLPWPLDRVSRRATARVHQIATGDHHAAPQGDGARERVQLWTEAAKEVDEHGHAKHDEDDEGDALVLVPRAVPAGTEGVVPVNLLTASATVTYRISDLKLSLNRVEEPAELLKALTERELCFLLSGQDLDQLLRDRKTHAHTLTTRLRVAVAEQKLGIEILDAALTDLHPPIPVGEAFERVSVAHEQAQTKVIAARIEAQRISSRSLTEAEWLVQQANVQARAKVALKKADADRFEGQILLDRAAPGVYRAASLLDQLVTGARGKRKIILGRSKGIVLDLDLQEKVSVEEVGLGRGLLDSAKETTLEGGKK